MLPGYNTNGFAHHRLEDAIEILAELGYRSVAITLDWHALNPRRKYEEETAKQRDRVVRLLRRHGMRCVVETGARFLVDIRRKHHPTLLDPEEAQRSLRLDFLSSSCWLASEIEADAVSFWSGKAPAGEPEDDSWERLVAGCRWLCDRADRRGVRLAFEPEPGMFIDTMAKFEELHRRVDHPRFGLTLDIGHLQCMGEMPARPHIERWKDVLWNVHIEDMRRGVHDHLPFGEGEIDFDEVFGALRDVGYQGGLHVELSRHSHDAVEAARQSMEFLRRYIEG
ncbi:MAG: sugar phosphate isomerase/epimerase family protein [Gemmataceae bacterium]